MPYILIVKDYLKGDLMFKNIYFIDFHFDQPISSEGLKENYDQLIPIYENMDDYSIYEEDKNIIITLEGESKTIGLIPINNFVENHLLYLQIFSLMNAGKNYRTVRRNYHSYLILYTYEGEGILEYDHEKYVLTKGKGFLIDCRKQHSYYTNGGKWYHSFLHFNGKRAHWFYEKFIESKNVEFDCPIDGFYQNQLEQLLESYQKSGPYREVEVSIKLETLLLSLLKEKNKHYEIVPDYIIYLQKYMESNFTHSLTLDDLSSLSGVSKYHLSREFKKYTGYSPNAYLIELRIGRAKSLLSTSSLPIYKISELSGFMTEVNFINLFKKHTGLTPSKYRNNNTN